MRYAIGVTLVATGAILIYSGFKNVPVWDNVLAVVRGTPAIKSTSTSASPSAG